MEGGEVGGVDVTAGGDADAVEGDSALDGEGVAVEVQGVGVGVVGAEGVEGEGGDADEGGDCDAGDVEERNGVVDIEVGDGGQVTGRLVVTEGRAGTAVVLRTPTFVLWTPCGWLVAGR